MYVIVTVIVAVAVTVRRRRRRRRSLREFALCDYHHPWTGACGRWSEHAPMAALCTGWTGCTGWAGRNLKSMVF